MTPKKQWRVATAAGFLAGVLICLDEVRDARILWPPDVLWDALGSPQRLKFGAGVALMVVSFLASVLQQRAR
jgi:hypothetical protein